MLVVFGFQIKEKLEKVISKQQELSEKWDKHWEFLQHRKHSLSKEE